MREGKAPVETRTCINKRVSTLLNFHCDLLANWTNSAPNVSQYANVTSVISCNVSHIIAHLVLENRVALVMKPTIINFDRI